MPVVLRAEDDLLRLTPISNILVCPCNCMAYSSGLVSEFSSRFDGYWDDLSKASIAGEIKLGKPHVFKMNDKIIISLPTKEHFIDTSTLEDITIGIRRIGDYLEDLPYHTVTMPVLRCGMGDKDIETSSQMIISELDSLSNVIHLCARPAWFKKISETGYAGIAKPQWSDGYPKYLGVIGDRRFSDFNQVRDIVQDTVVNKWGLSFDYFDGIVSGGAPIGVDQCAISDNKDIPDIARTFSMRPIVARADWGRYGRSAGMIRNRTVVDIATHLIALPTEKSIGTRGAIQLCNQWNVNETKPYEKKLQVTEVVCADT